MNPLASGLPDPKDKLDKPRRAAELVPDNPAVHVSLRKALAAKGLETDAGGNSPGTIGAASAVTGHISFSRLKRLQLLVGCCCLLATVASGQTNRTSTAVRKLPPNVLLITIDTVRADHLGCYGYTKIQTPTLDSLAHDGIVFERAISQVPLTWPSHTAILTGTYPFQNGVQDFTGQPLDPRFRSVAQAFKKNGYVTGAVVSAFVLDRSFGLARGFDFYDDAFSAETFLQKDLGLVDRKAEESVDHTIRWLRTKWYTQAPRRPFFLWLHLYDPHSPYDPPEPFRSNYRDHLYDGEIAYADHELGQLIAWLKSHQVYDSSIIVFLSDHGESLGDHGEKEHGFFIYNSTVHVPLIVKPPATRGFQPHRVSDVAETVAIAPTLLRLAGLKDEIEKQFDSPSLIGSSSSHDQVAYSETFYPFSFFGWSPLHALETGRYHYIDAPQPELYEVNADPGEQVNLASAQPATVAVLKERLRQRLQNNPFASNGRNDRGLDEDVLKKLRALGYFGYRSAVYRSGSDSGLDSKLPDPKERLWEFNATLDASEAFGEQDFAKGESLLRQVREKDPHQYIIPFMLGEAALRQRLWDRAASDLQDCLRLNPNFDQAMTSLARALYQKGDTAGAVSSVNNALQLNPENYRAWYELGLINSKQDKTSATAAFEKSISIQPNFAMSHRDFGMLLFHEGNYSDAAHQIEEAIRLGMHAPTLYNFLGIAYSRTNRVQLAVTTYQEALKLDPNLAEAHLNLAYAYQRLKRLTAAKSEYRTACRLDEKYCKFSTQQ